MPIVVVDRLSDWPWTLPGVKVVEARAYLNRDAGSRRTPVWSFASRIGYQRTGYYVALLAEARGHRVWPDVGTIQDFKSRSHRRTLLERLGASASAELAATDAEVVRLQLLFGQPLRHPELAQLGAELFERLPIPGLEVVLERRDKEWEVRGLDLLDLTALTDKDREAAEVILRERLAQPQRGATAVQQPRFELAILHDPNEAEPPSSPEALRRFAAAAERLDVRPTFITRADYARLPSFDALLIRETTAVHHHTFRFARRAEADGLAVFDDPSSIFRCCSKVFLAEALRAAGVPTPRSMIVDRSSLDRVADELGLPCVLKAPDGSFGRGVVRCKTREEVDQVGSKLLERSDVIVAQAFAPTEYDWRIGLLDGQPLYASRYFMAPGHWQIVSRDDEGKKVDEGEAETVAVADAPRAVVEVAQRAAAIVGDGLYGVDLKQTPTGEILVIEVNDNPSIDAGVEDDVLGDALYEKIVESLVARVERRRRIVRVPS
ncbi:MAG: RimK family alpha-L-glutamate ligase [Sandaracinus sp.]|nr:RimK family alpha-L-glutamate ligase [Sandaracinus sp.]